jgi:hypothetical protein
MRWLLYLGLILFLPLVAHADCVCIKDPHRSPEKIESDRKDEYERAAAVFAGKVVALDAYTITFKVVKSWKGTSGEKVILSSGAVKGFDGTPLPEECSHQFKPGEECLVYAYGPAEKMKTSTCSTFALKDAAEEEKGLDRIKPHETVKQGKGVRS